MKKIDFELPLSECGTHVGCFRQPHSCAIEHCDVAITWKVVVNETKGATPASRILMYKKGNGWIGFGFSQDRIMVSGFLLLLEVYVRFCMWMICCYVHIVNPMCLMTGRRLRHDVHSLGRLGKVLERHHDYQQIPGSFWTGKILLNSQAYCIHIPFCSHSPCTELLIMQQYGVLLDQWFYKAPEGDSSGYFKCNVTRAMNYKEWSKGEEAEGENKFFIDLKIPYRLFIAQGPSKTNPIS